MLEKHNQDLVLRSRKLQEEVDLLRDIESSAEKDHRDMKNDYERQKKELENMGLEKKDLEVKLQNLKLKHEEEKENLKTIYETAADELREDIRELQKGYGKKISEITTELNKYREDSREKEYQINQLNKGMESGNAHVKELQKELNEYKENYFNLQNKQNEAKKKIQELEWNVQQHSGSSTRINKLREHIKKIEPELIDYKKQIQQKEMNLMK